QAKSYEQIAAVSDASFSLTTQDGKLPEQVAGQFASANLFVTLGIAPAIGRTFASNEDSLQGPLLAVIGDSLWRRGFGADPNVVGSQIRLNGVNYTLIGVMPSGFDYPTSQSQVCVALWRHIDARSQRSRGNHRLNLVARLRPGVSVESAGGELNGI